MIRSTGRTTIEFALLRPIHAELAVYHVRGQRVKTLANEARDAGRHEMAWDYTDWGGRRVSPGVYLCRLRAGGRKAVRKAAVVE